MSETINGVSILSAETKRALVADVQFFETFTSAAFNRKLKGIVKAGFYEGFEPIFTGGLTLTITSKNTPDKYGAASVNVGDHQISVHQIEDVTFTLPAGATTRVVLEANYQQGIKTDQVDANSGVQAARLFLSDVKVALKGNQLEVCRVNIPNGTTDITAAMVSTAERPSQTIGVEMTSDINSQDENIAASAKSVYLAFIAAKEHSTALVATKLIGATQNLNTLGPGSEGRWSKSVSSGATIENGFPEEQAVGILEVIPGGQYGGTQRYTSRTGNVYVRSLTASWNGTDGPWGPWRATQMATRPLSTTLDLNTLGNLADIGLWRNSYSSIASATLNFPVEAGEGMGVLEVFEGGRFNITQRYTTCLGRIFTRSLNAAWNGTNGPWSAWIETNDRRGTISLGSLNAYGPNHIGAWACLNSTYALATNNYPIEGSTGIGVLEVYSGGNALLQRFTSRFGRMFTRTLNGAWNGTDGPWSAWVEVGTANITNLPADAVSMADPRYFYGNVIYTINSAMPDMPEGIPSPSACVLVSYKRNYIAGASINQQLMVPGGRLFYRSASLSGANNDWNTIAWNGGDAYGWKEVLTTDSIGNAYGIGGNTPIKTVDFNAYDFKSGETFYFSPAAAINLPEGLSWGVNVNVGCHVIFASDLYYNLLLIPTTTNKNEKSYIVRMRGAPGTVRTYAVGELHESGRTLGVEFGGTGGTTPAEARISLELNSRFIPAEKNINEIGPDLEGRWTKTTSSGTTFANGFPEEGTVGVLEVFAGGNFGGTQIFTSRSSMNYMRNLVNTWNGKDGPWGEWRTLQMGTRPLSNTTDINTLGAAIHLGLWRNSSMTIATEANHYPVSGSEGQGLLEIFEGGLFGKSQRYTTHKGLIYVRSLSANWNGVDGPWGEWALVGTSSHPGYYKGDMDLLTTPGVWSVTDGDTGVTNAPVTPGAPTSSTAICEVILRSSTNSILQRWTSIVGNKLSMNRSWIRTLAGNIWSPWEVVGSKAVTDLGMGVSNAELKNFDWQRFNFQNGAFYNVVPSSWLNAPAKMAPLASNSATVMVHVKGMAGDAQAANTPEWCHFEVITYTLTSKRIFAGIYRGLPGERQYYIHELFHTANTTIAADGSLKAASPIVKIFTDGTYENNIESEGVTVSRLEKGLYLIKGCTGLNADASWGGTDGGFDIPIDKNKQPLLWLDYEVHSDGSILVKTYHRVHANSPLYAQNRIGYEDENGKFIETVADQEPIDIPPYQFVSVRVQMSQERSIGWDDYAPILEEDESASEFEEDESASEFEDDESKAEANEQPSIVPGLDEAAAPQEESDEE